MWIFALVVLAIAAFAIPALGRTLLVLLGIGTVHASTTGIAREG